jgi:hypothetical protein
VLTNKLKKTNKNMANKDTEFGNKQIIAPAFITKNDQIHDHAAKVLKVAILYCDIFLGTQN